MTKHCRLKAEMFSFVVVEDFRMLIQPNRSAETD